MSIKITDIRNKYDFMTEEEKAEAYQLALENKVAELKAKHANDEKYAKFTDEDWFAYAEVCLKTKAAINTQSFYYGLASVDNDPETAEWAQFTYEEILQMEGEGVLIPDKVLAWAHSMQDSDVTSYEIDENTSTEQTAAESDNSELAKMEKEAQKLSIKSKQANEKANLKYVEFQEISKQAEQIQREQESSQKDSLKEIQDLTKEYADFAERVKRGEQLSDSERKRYQELGTMLNGEDGELVTDVQASTMELEELMNSMDGLNKDIKTNIKLGDDTVEAATQLAMYEKNSDSMNVEPNFFANVATGEVLDELYGAQGETIARDALDSGKNLIEFSNTLSNTLMMNQYTSLYNFATTFTTDANETIGETQEVMGEDFNKSSEEFEDETNVETPEEEKQQLDMKDLATLGLGSKKLIKKDVEVGLDAEKLGKEALAEIDAVNKKQQELGEKKQAITEEQAEAMAETPEEPDAPEVEEPTTVEDAQKAQDTQEEQQEQATQEPNDGESLVTRAEALDGEIAANNDKGLTAEERLQKSLKINQKFDDFNKDANSVMDRTCNVGTVSTMYGGVLIVNGANLIAAGIPLLPNPFTNAIGTALITQGTITTTAGVGFVGIGGSLIAIGLNGIDATVVTGEQIDLADENIQKAIDEIGSQDGIENGEEEQPLSAAQSERAEMQANGASLPEQARHFRDRSNDEAMNSFMGIMQTKAIEAESNKETKVAELTAKVIESRMKSKKEEYDELKEKQEAAEEANKKFEEHTASAQANGIEAQAQQPKEEFTEQDEERMNKLGSELENVGNKGQQKLYNSLARIEGFEEFLADKEETALTSIDYGEVAQLVGMELYDQSKGNMLLIFRMILALSTMSAGKKAQTAGTTLDKVADVVEDVNDVNKSKIQDAQTKVAEVTMAPAMSTTTEQSEDGETNEEDSPQTEETTPESSQADSPKLTGAAAIVASMKGQKFVDQAQENAGIEAPQGEESSSDTSSNKTEEDPEKQGANVAKKEGETKKQVSESNKEVASANKEIKSTSKDSQKEAKSSKKTEKQLELEAKNLTKLIEQDTKKIEQLSEESQEAVEEQLALAAEYETLNAQVEEANARVMASQQKQQAAAPAPQAKDQQGGLLSSAPQSSPAGGDVQQDVVVINTNQARMSAIGARFVALDQKVVKNRVQIGKFSLSISKRHRKFEKVTKEKIKIQKAAQKAEMKKQKRMQKLMAGIEVVNTTFSIVTSVGTIMEIVGTKMVTAGTAMIATGTPMLSNPFTAAAGAALIAGGTVLEVNGTALGTLGAGFQTAGMIGVAACGLTKAGIAIANGDIKGAFMQLGATIISVAMNFVPGVGGAASAGMTAAQSGLQIASASLNIVSSSATMAANVQTLAGKEQSGWLGTVSQIAGVAGSLTNAGAGLAGGVGSGFGAATKIMSTAGAAVSATATISSLIKQAQGKDPGKFENIMSMIGTGLSTAASLMTLGQMAFGADSTSNENDSENSDNDKKANKTDNKKDKNDDPNKTKNDNTVDDSSKNDINDPKTQKMIEKAEKLVEENGFTPDAQEKIQAEINKLPADKRDAVIKELKKAYDSGENSEQVVETEEVETETSEVTETSEIVSTSNDQVISQNTDAAKVEQTVKDAQKMAEVPQEEAPINQETTEEMRLAATKENQEEPDVETENIATKNVEEDKPSRAERRAERKAEKEAARKVEKSDDSEQQNVNDNNESKNEPQKMSDEELAEYLAGDENYQKYKSRLDGLDGTMAGLESEYGFERGDMLGSLKLQGQDQETYSMASLQHKMLDRNLGEYANEMQNWQDGSLGQESFYQIGTNKYTNLERITLTDGQRAWKTDQGTFLPGANGKPGGEMVPEERMQLAQANIQENNDITNSTEINNEATVQPVENESTDQQSPEEEKPQSDNNSEQTLAESSGVVTGAASEAVTPDETQTIVSEAIQSVDDATSKLNQNSESIDEIQNYNNENSAEQVDPNAETTEVENETLSRKELKAKEEAEAQKTFANKVAENQGLKTDEEQVLNGTTFEVTADGKCLVNGQEVNPSELMGEIKAAKANSALEQKSFDETAVGGIKEIDGNIFEKQEDGTFKLVSGYDNDMNRQLSDQNFASEDLFSMSQGTDEQRAQWQKENIDPIKNQEANAVEMSLSSESLETDPQTLISEQQQQQAIQLAEQNGLKAGKEQIIDGQTFEVTKNGECLIDGQKVHPGEMKDKLSVAKANSDALKKQLADGKVGESQFINGGEFVKQEDGSFKLVSEYDENLEQQFTRDEFSADEVHNVGMMSEEKGNQWVDSQIKSDETQQKFEKTVDVLGKVSEAFAGGMQMAQAASSLAKDDDNSEQKRNILQLSNMKKGKALMKKIKRRREVLGNYGKYQG